MVWQVIVALVIAIPIILIPVIFVWYLNMGGIYQAFQAARQRRKAARQRTVKVPSETEPN